jgi:hypothetical protein
MKRLLFTLCYFLYFLSYAQSPLKAKEISPRINYLKRIINQPLNDDADIIHLAQENPEFMLFSYAFSTYAFTNLAISDSVYKEEAISLIKESIVK